MKRIVYLFALCLLLGFNTTHAQQQPTKLYWFIPDGVRAEPDLFNIYEWAQKGYLPNIKYMMDHGVSGYSKPLFPTHTPVNFAGLLSGTTPKVNGVADGPMHTEGFPLSKISVGGFRSSARRVPAIWSIMEKAGKKTVMLSVPGSTPPEIDNGVVVRGRWGGWGAETYSLVFEKQTDNQRQFQQGRSVRLFFNGPKLAQYLNTTEPTGWATDVQSYSPAFEVALNAYGINLYAYVYDNTNDKKTNYNRILFSFDKKTIIADIAQGEWGKWTPCTATFDGHPFQTDLMPGIIKLDEDGYFRIRLLYNNLNKSLTMPEEAAAELTKGVGPMVDYADNFPPQLIYYKEDKKAFQDEMGMSFAWHKRAIAFTLNTYHPDVVIHDIYSPNQMLTSRWWLGYVDPAGSYYATTPKKDRDALWNEVKAMYLQLDSMVGEIIANTDSNTLIVFSSDHGACPLNTSIMVNNLLAKNGYLHFTLDKVTGEPIIDWEKSKAIYLKMDGVFINPDGLAGNWKRGSGPEYEKLRDEISSLLVNLKADNGDKPITSVTKWEDAEQFLDLPKDRVGDLIISNKAGYGFNEEFTEDLAIYAKPLVTGYKQAILADDVKAMWTPFIIMGKGVKQGVMLDKPISHIDQLPTILQLMGMEIPSYVEGKPVKQVFK